MGYYYENRLRARTVNNQPSLTEQSMAKDTDINIIVQKFRTTGRVPGSDTEPMSGDFTEMPEDLRGFIECAKSMMDHRAKLPLQLRHLATNQLLNLTPQQLTNILTPPAPKPAEENK